MPVADFRANALFKAPYGSELGVMGWSAAFDSR